MLQLARSGGCRVREPGAGCRCRGSRCVRTWSSSPNGRVESVEAGAQASFAAASMGDSRQEQQQQQALGVPRMEAREQARMQAAQRKVTVATRPVPGGEVSKHRTDDATRAVIRLYGNALGRCQRQCGMQHAVSDAGGCWIAMRCESAVENAGWSEVTTAAMSMAAKSQNCRPLIGCRTN